MKNELELRDIKTFVLATLALAFIAFVVITNTPAL